MNTANVLACITISMLFGLAVGYVSVVQDNGKFTIHKTRSGMFIVNDSTAEAKIYEVLELPTNQPSFQNEGKNND